MIQTKDDLKEYIKADNEWYKYDSLKTKMIYCLTSKNIVKIKKFLLYLRKCEFHMNNSNGSRYHTYIAWYYERKKNRLGREIGVEIGPNCFGKGLQIWHGGIVVNPFVRAGDRCILHGNNCIGNKGGGDDIPHLGNHVDIGFGATVIGDVFIPDDIVIGANAVVNKTFGSGKTLVGVPAHVVG